MGERDPHRGYHELRAAGPVHWSDEHDGYLVVGHAEASAAFRDPALSSERIPAFEHIARQRAAAFAQVVDLFRGWMVFRDPPAHTRLRDPVRRVFTPQAVDRLTSTIEALVEPQLDELGEQASVAPVDFVEAFARPLPALVIAELLGVPASDRTMFQEWSDRLGTIVFAASTRTDDDAAAIAAAGEFDGYFRELVRHYEVHPADNLVSRMVEARRSGSGLDDTEVIGACTLLLFAGHETTTSLLVNGTWLLSTHPDEKRAWLADPSLDVSMVEELMRYEGPARTMQRRALAPTSLGGHPIEAGKTVYLVMMAANRDPAVFDDPDRLDLARDPNPHLGFGWGMHYCLGAPLARLEARIAFRRLFERFPDLAPVVDEPAWGGGFIGRSLRWLPVRLS